MIGKHKLQRITLDVEEILVQDHQPPFDSRSLPAWVVSIRTDPPLTRGNKLPSFVDRLMNIGYDNHDVQ